MELRMHCYRLMTMKNVGFYSRIAFILLATSVSVGVWCLYGMLPRSIQEIKNVGNEFNHGNENSGTWNSNIKSFLIANWLYKQYNNSNVIDIVRKHENLTGNVRDGMKSPFIDPVLHLDKNSLEEKLILWWNAPGWLLPWQEMTDMTKCQYKNCRVSFEKKDFQKSNAVVFSIGDAGMGHIPPVSMKERNPDQAWLFFTLESPIHVKRASQAILSPHWHNALNWSWNYRPDSDIFHPYGRLNARHPPLVRNYSDIFRNKRKTIAWLVSHCGSIGGRDKYVDILKKYISVDIYGRCGQYAPDNIDQIISKDYKFYLGFENSLCINYVTEKFFHYYSMDTITVLRGKTNYSEYFPANSFIDTADFPNIKALAERLKQLSENEEEFIKYMKIKDQYEITERAIIYQDAVCNVCEKLNNLNQHRRIYKNAAEWMGICDLPKDIIEK
ncbi:fucosyltransferase 4 [Mactra antiquata]